MIFSVSDKIQLCTDSLDYHFVHQSEKFNFFQKNNLSSSKNDQNFTAAFPVKRQFEITDILNAFNCQTIKHHTTFFNKVAM